MTGGTSATGGSNTGGGPDGYPSGTSPGGNGGTPSQTGGSTQPPAIDDICPGLNHGLTADSRGVQYRVRCNSQYSGNIISTTNSTMPRLRKRQVRGVSLQACMEYCDDEPRCEAINLSCTGTCKLLGAVSNVVTPVSCGLGLKKVKGSGGNGGVVVITKTVCAAQHTRTTTLSLTKTKTTCPAGGQCTAHNGMWS